jgi:hypothetical protein
MSDQLALAKAMKAMRLQGVLFMMAGLAFMLVSVLQTKQGRSGATWIAIGAVFLALGGAAMGRAKKLAETMQVPPTE